MIENNLVLYLPFDDPDGSVAHDFSKNRNDATLSGGATLTQETAKTGKSLALNYTGEALTSQALPFGSDFTLCLSVRTTSDKIGWLLNGSGVDNYIEQWISVDRNKWNDLAFVKQGSSISVYRGGVNVYRGSIDGTPIGFSINDQNVFGSAAMLDDVRLYNTALDLAEIIKVQNDTNDVEYYIDGVNFKTFGVNVSGSNGLVGQLARKESLTVDWDSYHGTVRDNTKPRFKSREISLACFLEASSRTAFVDWTNRFFGAFQGKGTHRLKVEYSGHVKPLVYEVVCLDSVDPNKTWGRYNEELMVGTFTIKLIEDEPVKRVLKWIGSDNSTANIKVTSSKLLNIYWGDGTHTYNVKGTDKEISHIFEKAGEYEIIVSGVIEDIEKFETNAILLWENLH